jgi:RNA polymerase sigma factor (TIGR02999 family)
MWQVHEANGMSDVTCILAEIESGDPSAADRLLPLVYQELRRLAAYRLSQERLRQTLSPTALVHEAYLRMARQGCTEQWDSRGHFFAAAAEAMRRILVERARRRKTCKHGGQILRVNLDDVAGPEQNRDRENLLALDEALKLLETEDSFKSQLVKLRYFAGLTNEQTADVLGVSAATVKRHWNFARAWLYGKLTSN